ncbi:MAG: PmoA family protein [Bacteroidota bacterium]
MKSLINVKGIIALLAIIPLIFSCAPKHEVAQEDNDTTVTEENSVKLIRNDTERKVDVLVNGKLFTAYQYPESIMKPVLYPLVTPKGTVITRKYPLEKSVGERVDHPHHCGIWFNYGDVNGLDFWNNSEAIKPESKDKYGSIVHKEIKQMQDGKDAAVLETSMDWIAPNGKVLLKESTKFVFGIQDDHYYIDRFTTLTAQDETVSFNDNKEGVLGIRVTRALEHPSDKPEIFTDANGIPTDVPSLNNEGVNGKYYNSEGVEGVDCWGKRANWMNLTSTIGNENISLVILDHPENVGYPTYWHARGYGLFAANPLGQKVFSDGKEELNFKLAGGESTTFRHRIVVASANLDKATLDKVFTRFSTVKM